MKFICLAHNPPFPLPHILFHFTRTVAYTSTHAHTYTHQPKMNCANFLPQTEPVVCSVVQVHSTFYFNSIYFFLLAFLMRFIVAHTHVIRIKDKYVFNIGIDKTRLTKRSLFLISFWFIPWPRHKILHRMFCLCSRSANAEILDCLNESLSKTMI